MKSITEKATEMTAEEKIRHIDRVEFCRDYGCGEHISDEDYAIYNALVKERTKMQREACASENGLKN